MGKKRRRRLIKDILERLEILELFLAKGNDEKCDLPDSS